MKNLLIVLLSFVLGGCANYQELRTNYSRTTPIATQINGETVLANEVINIKIWVDQKPKGNKVTVHADTYWIDSDGNPLEADADMTNRTGGFIAIVEGHKPDNKKFFEEAGGMFGNLTKGFFQAIIPFGAAE